LPIRVCHLITDLDTGGAERSVVNLLVGMDQDEFKCDVVTMMKPGAMAEPLIQSGIPVTSLGMRRGRPNPLGLVSLIRHLRLTKPAILQTWLYHADLIGTVATRIVPPNRLVWNVRCTDMTAGDAKKWTRWLVRSLAALSGRPDAIVVNSQQGRADHERLGYVPKRWVNIPNGVDFVRFRPRDDERRQLRTQLGIKPDALTIGFVARDHPMKDVQTFFRAAALLIKKEPANQFVVCGDGLTLDNARLTRILAGLDLQRHVVLLGPRREMESVYPALDVLALCSIYGEGFPNVLVEAMACGVPCVATDVGDCRMIVGDCGMIVPARNPEALAQACEMLIHMGLYGIGARARARVVANFGLQEMRARYQSLYRSLIGANSAQLTKTSSEESA
jgi:glycosyltransferase involved in cell wall biosynthesis